MAGICDGQWSVVPFEVPSPSPYISYTVNELKPFLRDEIFSFFFLDSCCHCLTQQTAQPDFRLLRLYYTTIIYSYLINRHSSITFYKWNDVFVNFL